MLSSYLSVVEVEMQIRRNCNFSFWLPVGGCGCLIDGFGPLVPLLVVAGRETKLTSFSGNQAFTFSSLTWD